jgi:nicotinate-nucleotide adenylyltransferase
MRLGIYGGTFDPIHIGHLILAEACREACQLDHVWFVVAPSPPHKSGGRTDVGHRIEMARIAVAGHASFEVSEIETKRPGPHYSVDTLAAINSDRPDDELFFLIGADSLVDLPTWRSPDKIGEMATLVVVNRPATQQPNTDALAIALGAEARPIQHVTIPPIGVASNDLRRRVQEGRSIRYQTPRGVEAYIEAHGLYR